MGKGRRNSICCIWNEPCCLGEAPIWHPVENVLYWVDILGPKLHRLDPIHQHHQSWTMPTAITCIAPHQRGGLIAAFKQGIAILNPICDQVSYLDTLSEEVAALSMFNDGHCDKQGRLWVGTKNINEIDLLNAKPQGEIFQFGPDQHLIKHAEDFYITNGLVFSLDSKYFYVADSPRRIIYRYEFDSDSGQIHHPVVFATIAEDAGFPDGMTLDSEGCLWSCHFGGWRITRYSPDGKVDRMIPMPISSPTSCCFGGKDLKTLFITSAKRDVTESELIHQPNAGAVFAIEVDVPGLPESCYSSMLV